MLIQLVIGAAAAATLLLLVHYARQRGLALGWWQWVLTVLAVLYAVFVIEVIVGFLGEGTAQAAAVLGLITAIPAVIWGVLLARFVFRSGRSDDAVSQRATAE
jgi:hypothetical protein